MRYQKQMKPKAGSEDVVSPKLPAEVHDIIERHWQRVEKDLAKEELLMKLDCFCRFMERMPGELVERDLKEPDILVAMREFFKLFGFPVREKSSRYRNYNYNVFLEFFNKAWASLNPYEQKFIVFVAKNAVHSISAIARAMNFPSPETVESFQRRCFLIVTKTLYTLLMIEAERPGLAPQRQKVVRAWVEHFRQKAPALL